MGKYRHKNPNHSDREELIGSDTVNTIPPATFEAFRDRGRPRASLQEHLEEAHAWKHSRGQHLNAGCHGQIGRGSAVVYWMISY